MLLRAGEVVAGRGAGPRPPSAARGRRELARGPARLASALGLDGSRRRRRPARPGVPDPAAGRQPRPGRRGPAGPRVGVAGAAPTSRGGSGSTATRPCAPYRPRGPDRPVRPRRRPGALGAAASAGRAARGRPRPYGRLDRDRDHLDAADGTWTTCAAPARGHGRLASERRGAALAAWRERLRRRAGHLLRAASTRPRRACTSATWCSAHAAPAPAAGPPPLVPGRRRHRLIGDPSGRAERTLNAARHRRRTGSQNIRRQIEQLTCVLDRIGAAVMVNNLDWTGPMSMIEFLRDVGKHFRVNRMLEQDAVAARLTRAPADLATPSSATSCCRASTSSAHRRTADVELGGTDQRVATSAGRDLSGHGRAATCGARRAAAGRHRRRRSSASARQRLGIDPEPAADAFGQAEVDPDAGRPLALLATDLPSTEVAEIERDGGRRAARPRPGQAPCCRRGRAHHGPEAAAAAERRRRGARRHEVPDDAGAALHRRLVHAGAAGRARRTQRRPPAGRRRRGPAGRRLPPARESASPGRWPARLAAGRRAGGSPADRRSRRGRRRLGRRRRCVPQPTGASADDGRRASRPRRA